MANLNSVEIIGRVGRDPKAVTTKAGKTIVTFTVAVDASYKDQAGTLQKETEWFFCKCFGAQAPSVAKYLHKGSSVYVHGAQRTEKWSDAQGQEHTLVVLVARNIQFLDPFQKTESTAMGAGSQTSGMSSEIPDECPF